MKDKIKKLLYINSNKKWIVDLIKRRYESQYNLIERNNPIEKERRRYESYYHGRHF